MPDLRRESTMTIESQTYERADSGLFNDLTLQFPTRLPNGQSWIFWRGSPCFPHSPIISFHSMQRSRPENLCNLRISGQWHRQ